MRRKLAARICVAAIPVALLATAGAAAAETPTLTSPTLSVTVTTQPNFTFDYTATWTRVPGATSYFVCVDGVVLFGRLCNDVRNRGNGPYAQGTPGGGPGGATLSFTRSGIGLTCDPHADGTCTWLNHASFSVVACNPRFQGEIFPFPPGCGAESNEVDITIPLP
jgi:hypothetical protein